MKSILALLIVSAPVIAMEQPKQVKPVINQPAKVTGIVVAPRAVAEVVCFAALCNPIPGPWSTAAKISASIAMAEMYRRDNQ